MSIIDKITGRTKKAAGDLTGDASLRRQGAREERKGEAKDQLDNAQEKVERQGRRGRGPRTQDLINPHSRGRDIPGAPSGPRAARLLGPDHQDAFRRTAAGRRSRA